VVVHAGQFGLILSFTSGADDISSRAACEGAIAIDVFVIDIGFEGQIFCPGHGDPIVVKGRESGIGLRAVFLHHIIAKVAPEGISIQAVAMGDDVVHAVDVFAPGEGDQVGASIGEDDGFFLLAAIISQVYTQGVPKPLRGGGNVLSVIV